MPDKKHIKSDTAHISGPSFGHRIALGRTVHAMPLKETRKYVLPKRPPDESSKFCRLHDRRQKRRIVAVGPMDEIVCLQIPVKKPRNSHWGIWRIFSITRHYISPVEEKWYVIAGSVECPDCQDTHREKFYRRLYGRFGLAMLKLKAHWFPGFYSIIPFDPNKPLKEHFKK